MSDEAKTLFTILWVIMVVTAFLFGITPEAEQPTQTQTVILRHTGSTVPAWNLQMTQNGLSIMNSKTGEVRLFTNNVVTIDFR